MTCCSLPSRGFRPRPSIPAGSSCRCCTWPRAAYRPAGAPPRGRVSRPHGRGGGRRARLRPGAAVCGHGQSPGVPGRRRLPGNGRRHGTTGTTRPSWTAAAARYGVLWRPLLVEGLVGSGRSDEAAVALQRLRDQADEVAYLQPALAWLEGWLAEEQGQPDRAGQIYQAGEDRHRGQPALPGPVVLCLRPPPAPYRSAPSGGRTAAASQRSVHRPRGPAVRALDRSRAGEMRAAPRAQPNGAPSWR